MESAIEDTHKAQKKALVELFKLSEDNEEMRKIITNLLTFSNTQLSLMQNMLQEFAKTLVTHMEKGHADVITKKELADFIESLIKKNEQEKKKIKALVSQYIT
jgi:F0F1-type ATP synthase delta subunit